MHTKENWFLFSASRCSSAHTHTHTFNGPFSRTTRVGRYQKGKTKLDFTEARDSEWQWHQLGHMQVCTSFQTDNHASTLPLSFLQAGCPSCHPTNSVKALKAFYIQWFFYKNNVHQDTVSIKKHNVAPVITCPTPALNVNGFCPGSFVLQKHRHYATTH